MLTNIASEDILRKAIKCGVQITILPAVCIQDSVDADEELPKSLLILLLNDTDWYAQ